MMITNDQKIKELDMHISEKKNTELNIKNVDDYKHVLCLSAYDHWLSEDEANEKILSFSCIDDINKEKYFDEEEKFLDFYKYIYNKYEFLIFFPNKELINKKPKDLYSFLRICQKSIREETFVDIYIQGYDLLIAGTYDMNILICCNDISLVEKFKLLNFVKGLYFLEKQEA